jgi:hypothetical protein
MGWKEAEAVQPITEWERDDGVTTIRMRERPDGTWMVRLDRLFQAPEGNLYRRKTLASREEALDLVEEWQHEYDHEAE